MLGLCLSTPQRQRLTYAIGTNTSEQLDCDVEVALDQSETRRGSGADPGRLSALSGVAARLDPNVGGQLRVRVRSRPLADGRPPGSGKPPNA